MNNNDLNLAIRFKAEGGQVVVKEINGVSQSAGTAASSLKQVDQAGESAAGSMGTMSSRSAGLNNQLTDLKGTLGLVAGALGLVGAGQYFKSAVQEQEQLQRNMLRTQAVIEATSHAAGFSAEQLHQQARELALSTLQSTEGVMQAQQVLLSYSSITGDVFSRAIESATDLSTLIGGSLNGSLEMLAKTLDNPIEGINAMRRQGIYFSDAQQRVIKSLIDTNRLADAQTIILDTLAGQFGGIARKEALGLSGAYDTLNQAIQENKLALTEQLGTNEQLAGIVNDLAQSVFSFNNALTAGELDGYIDTLQLATTAVTALLAAKYGAAIASAIWVKAKVASTAASAAFAAQNALTLKSILSLQSAFKLAAAAFIGWEIGSYLRQEFAVVEKAGIALAAGVHKSLAWLGGQLDVLAEELKHALTHPLDYAREKLIDYLQWLVGLGGKTLAMLGLDDMFGELEGKLEGYRTKTGDEHRASLEKIKAETATELAQIDAIYGDMFANVAEGVDRVAKKTKDIPAAIPTPNLKPAIAESDNFNKALLDLYNTHKLNAAAVDAHGRALDGIDLELFKSQFVAAKDLPADAEAAIRSFIKTAQAAAAVSASDAYLKNLKQETSLLKLRLQFGEKEYEVQKALYQLKGGDPAVIAEIEAQIRAQQQLKDQIALTEEISSGAFDKMLNDMTAMNGLATNIGDVLVQAFGSVAKQLEAMTDGQIKYNDKIKGLAGERARLNTLDKNSVAYAKGLASLQEKETKTKENHFQSQMGHYSSLAGAAGKMFSEQSKGRQVMHKLEVTFAAIETALALKKAAANAITAITTQGQGDPYTAFARIATMAAIMAGLGVFSGSASGSGVSAEDRQKSQGTGTVLGDSDAKSDSIANALGRIEDLELDQYAELRSINGSIRELSAGIKNLAVNLVASYGRFNESNYPGELGKSQNMQLGSGLASVVGGGMIGLVADKLLGGLVGNITNKLLGGLFGSKKTELLDSGISFASQQLGDILASGLVNATVYDVIKTTKKKLFGLSKSSSENTEYRAMDDAVKAEFGRIFSHMGKSVTEAVQLLGLETNKTLENFVINLPNISFKDLSGDEIEKELQAIFSQQGDLMVQYLLPGIAEFQQMGEGLYDTLLRVAQEQAVFNSALDSLGHQLSRFSGVTKAMEVEIAQSLIEMMGGIENFQSLTADYFSEFYTEAERLAAATKSAQAQFASLGQTMPASRDGFKAMVASLDLTTESGMKMYAALLALNPLMDQFYDAQERQAKELAAFNKDIGTELAKLDMTDLQKNLFDLKAWYDAQIKEAAELGADTSLLEKLYDRKRAAMIAAELEKATADINNTFKQLVDNITAASAGIGNAILDIRRNMNGWDESAYQTGQVNQLRGQLGTGDIAAQIKNIQQLQSAIVSRYQADMTANSALMQQAQAALDNLNASWGELTSSLASVRGAISSAMLDIRRQGSGWNEASYQGGQVSGLRDKLGTGSVLDQINTVSALQQAIMDRYNAELAANQQLSAAAQERYEADTAAHNALRDAARQLLAAADALLLSDFSPALMGDQFKEAQKQFTNLLSRARGGDADAMQGLQGAGSSYLDLARDYFASGSSEYAAIFDEVQKAYRGFGGTANSSGPAVPREVLEYQASDAQLQQQTLVELEALQTLLDELEKQALAEKTAAEEKAKAEIAAYQAQQLELQLGAINELTNLQTMLVDLEAQAAAQRDAQLAAAQQQIDATTTLRDGLTEIAVAITNIQPPVIIINPPPPAPPAAAATSNADNSTMIGLLEQQLQQQQLSNMQQQRQMAALQDDLQRTQAMLYESRRLA